MRDKKRIDRFLKKLRLLWSRMPDLRFGQIVEGYLFTELTRLWHQEDDLTEEILDKYLKRMGEIE
jgi:hypothetical protein